MKQQITFAMSALAPVIEQTRAAKTHRIPYEGKAEPALWLVKDDGIYLMSSAKLRKGAAPAFTYANECDPTKDDQWYDLTRAIAGGDDFVEVLPLKMFDEAQAAGAALMRIVFKGDMMQIEFDRPAPVPSASGIDYARLASLKGRLKLESKGLKFRGKSTRSVLAAEFGLSPRAPYDKYIAECERRMSAILQSTQF